MGGWGGGEQMELCPVGGSAAGVLGGWGLGGHRTIGAGDVIVRGLWEGLGGLMGVSPVPTPSP